MWRYEGTVDGSMSPETRIEYILGLYVTKFHPDAAAEGNMRERWWKKDLLAGSWRLMVEDKEILEISEIELMSKGIYLPELPKPKTKPKSCTHENKIDITKMAATEREWVCQDCGFKHEAPTVPELDEIDKLTQWVREQELLIASWKEEGD